MSESPAAQDNQAVSSTQWTPEALVEEFKRQGHFDLIRKQILHEFQQSAHHAAFVEQADTAMMDALQKRPDHYVFRDARLRHSDLLRELDQNPLLPDLVEKLATRNATSEAAGDSHGEALLGPRGRIAHQVREQLSQMLQASESRTARSTDTPERDQATE
ncbi:hypothetical protein MBRA1_002805 [Malassezia brasiliensis]|uniref:BOD1/SHG1 domain-containing protein n=1 Tax=Malassezia brasiliensis TaxID=1821822 RepID=A0AAF0IPE5_9BASI|nr:hypothetical protein MBRA1_002805 [Malassezia brasiliensis]